MSSWEYIAVGLSLSYMLLAMQQSLWCWIAAFFSTFIYTLLFFNGALLMDSLLNIFYMAMAVYGWYSWRQNIKSDKQLISVDNTPLAIQSWPVLFHIQLIIVTMTVAIGLGYIMNNYTHTDYAYIDSITTCFSIITTYMLTKKVLENWLYWVVIDAVSIYIYINKGYYPTTILFVFFTFMAFWNYIQWKRDRHDINA